MERKVKCEVLRGIFSLEVSETMHNYHISAPWMKDAPEFQNKHCDVTFKTTNDHEPSINSAKVPLSAELRTLQGKQTIMAEASYRHNIGKVMARQWLGKAI